MSEEQVTAKEQAPTTPEELRDRAIRLTNEKWESWDLPQKAPEEQESWLQENLTPLLLNVVINGDQIDAVVVAEPLLDVVSHVIRGPQVPDELPFPLDPEAQQRWADPGYRAAVLGYITNLQVQAAPVEEMLVQDPAQMSAPDQFIRVTTRSMRVRTQVEMWYQSTGLPQSFTMRGIVIEPTYQEKRLLFFFSQLSEMLAAQAVQLKQATAPGEGLLFGR